MQQVAIITGASRGIGKACARRFAKENIKVVANYNKSKKQAEELKKELENEGIYIDIFKADVTKRNEIRRMVDYVMEKYGKIDALINNARNITDKTF